MKSLDDATHESIKALCAAGDKARENDNPTDSLRLYWKAWDLLPEPAEEWEAATWILGAVGDVNYHIGDYEAGRDNLSVAMRCPGGLGNPFLHLRLGQCRFELNELERAADDLARAYMGGGWEIFQEEDPKYFEWLSTKMDGIAHE